MIVIGVTGSMGTGKSTVAAMFKKKGAKVLDADHVAHECMRPGRVCYRKIVSCFGQCILEGRYIDRKKLAQRVFKNAEELKALEAIIHPYVIKEITRNIAGFRRKANVKAVVLDVPLLFESGLDRETDVTVTVKAKRQVQFERIKKKSGISKEEALRRIRAQLPLSEKARLSDFVINNSGPVPEAAEQVDHIWRRVFSKKF